MKCPLCQQEMEPVREGSTLGGLPGRPELALREVTGWNCLQQTNLPAGAKTPHCTVREGSIIITLFPYRLSNRLQMDGSTVSTLYHYCPDEDPIMGSGRFKLVADLPAIKITDEDTMLKKLAIYTLFS